jgi:molybdopterin synthase catalytic subunit
MMDVLTHQPLHPDMVRDAVSDDAHGAFLVFEGVVRNHFEGRAVIGLEYEAYPEMVEPFLEALKAEVQEKWPGTEIAVIHRLGRLEVGDTSLLLAASAPHRAEVYAASSHALEAIKAGLPVWKKEILADGSHWKPNAG